MTIIDGESFPPDPNFTNATREILASTTLRRFQVSGRVDNDKAAFFAQRGEEEQEQKNERLIEMLDGVDIRLPQLAHVCKGTGCCSGPQESREKCSPR